MSAPALTTAGRLAAGSSGSVADRARIEAVFDRAATGLYRYFVVRTGGDPHLADDLMQQLWLQAAGNGKAPVSEGELEPWLWGVARNLIRGHWRCQRARPGQVPIASPELAGRLAERLAEEELPAETLQRREVRDQLLLALTALPAGEQELIVGHYFQGRSHAELAREEGVSRRAIEGRLYRARRSLQQRLRELDP